MALFHHRGPISQTPVPFPVPVSQGQVPTHGDHGRQSSPKQGARSGLQHYQSQKLFRRAGTMTSNPSAPSVQWLPEGPSKSIPLMQVPTPPIGEDGPVNGFQWVF